jgi:hypothetical protein
MGGRCQSSRFALYFLWTIRGAVPHTLRRLCLSVSALRSNAAMLVIWYRYVTRSNEITNPRRVRGSTLIFRW